MEYSAKIVQKHLWIDISFLSDAEVPQNQGCSFTAEIILLK